LNFHGKRADGSRPAKDAQGNELNSFFFGQSSMARQALVHENSAVKIDARNDDELKLFASLPCGLQTGYGAVR